MPSVTPLPLIVGFGGFNAAGRLSGHQAYRRMILESLDHKARAETLTALAVMMGLVSFQGETYVTSQGESLSLVDVAERFADEVIDGTLIRRIEKTFFDVDSAHWQKTLTATTGEQPIVFTLRQRELPEPLPVSWEVTDIDGDKVEVSIRGQIEAKFDSYRELPVKSAGQLPRGFNPGDSYHSNFHPRALQLAVIGASDAVRSMGIEWSNVMDVIEPDQVGVYASNVMSQLDENGMGGLLQARLKGGRVGSKQCPLGLNTMPADFVNAYILGSVGSTGAITGACASFLYNLRAAVDEIRTGRIRVALVGSAEAPIVQEIIDGYSTMGALAAEDKLKKIDGTDETDPRRTSRPFGENAGFTIAEAATYVVLMDDALALELGAQIHGAVGGVFINADGFKKSISAPGPGNYITMAKAVASAIAIVGEDTVRQRSFVQAHGSSTPQNRVTESQIFDRVAELFDISDWPIAAVKAYVGHSLGSASGEQLIASLGVFKHGILPGIKTIDKVADDVFQARLRIPTQDVDFSEQGLDVAFLNSKGFGGNNATASIFSPSLVERMLTKRFGVEAVEAYSARAQKTVAAADAYDRAASQGNFETIYQFGQGMIDESQITMTTDEIRLPGFTQAINLAFESPYKDMV